MSILIPGEISEIIDERTRILKELNEAKNTAAQLHKHSSQIAHDATSADISEQIPSLLTTEGTPPAELAATLTSLETEFEKIGNAQAGIRTYEGQIQREKEKRRNLLIGAGIAAIVVIALLANMVFNQQEPIPTDQGSKVSPTSVDQQVASKEEGLVSETGANTPTQTKSATKVVTQKPTPSVTTTPSHSQKSTPTTIRQNPTLLNTATSIPTSTATSSVSPEETPKVTDTPFPGPSVSKPDLQWVLIPAGKFTLGSSGKDLEETLIECNETEGKDTGQPCQMGWFIEPQRVVFVNDFEITKYEITNSQYEACVADGVCNKANIKIENSVPTYDEGYFSSNYPVVRVNWNDANAFCLWVNGRLPTEEEWEKAARGTDGRRYPWGNAFTSSKANLGSTYPAPVGSFPEGGSPYGVMDMAGNVFEWTATWGERGYVLRGGGWNNYFFRGRVTDRGTQLEPDFANYDIGFRCARSG